jgi:circadian clock protein KaiC
MKDLADPRKKSRTIPKAPTGIHGLDEIIGGGLPRGRPTLVCGSAGCGKTLLAAEFIVRGTVEFNEPGVFMSFEENVEELTENVRSLGFDLVELTTKKKISLDYVRVERNEIEETGAYDLEGLFIRLGNAIDSVRAKRVVLDTIETLFAGLKDHGILRAELRRLFRWLKDRNVTAVITGERGENTLTREGLEEYVADCVILLDHRVEEQVSTRRMRVVKYRGSVHGTNEYPFLIGPGGISVLPITSLGLDHKASTERVSTGLKALDEMLGGKGVFRGTSILVSGTPGTGKSTLGASFADAACRRGERCLLFAYEESADQLHRNMRSVGFDLNKWVKKGLLQIHASRPTFHGLEQHLVMMHERVAEFRPAVVIVDPISNLSLDHEDTDIKPTLMRLIDFLKLQQITAMFTSLVSGSTTYEDSEVGVSSLMDTWLLLRNVEFNGERNRTIFVVKSRGMAHSNQVREFVIRSDGLELVDAYLGEDRVLTGTARVVQEAREKAAEEFRRKDHARKLRQLDAKRKAIESQIAVLRTEADAEAEEVRFAIELDNAHSAANRENASVLSRLRGGTPRSNGNGGRT